MNLLILLISLPKETLYTSVGKSTTKGTEEIEQGQVIPRSISSSLNLMMYIDLPFTVEHLPFALSNSYLPPLVFYNNDRNSY